MTTPGIGHGIFHQPGADRVEMNIPNQLQQILVGIHQNRLIPTLKHRATPGLLRIDPTGVAKGQIVQNLAQRRVLHLHHEMDVVGHTAKTMDAVSIPFKAFLDKQVQVEPVPLLEENILSSVPADHHMIDTAHDVQSGFSGHGRRVLDRRH